MCVDATTACSISNSSVGSIKTTDLVLNAYGDAADAPTRHAASRMDFIMLSG